MFSFFILQWRRETQKITVPIQPSQWCALGLVLGLKEEVLYRTEVEQAYKLANCKQGKTFSGNGWSLIQLHRGKMSLKLYPALVSRKRQSRLGWNSTLPILLSLMTTSHFSALPDQQKQLMSTVYICQLLPLWPPPQQQSTSYSATLCL